MSDRWWTCTHDGIGLPGCPTCDGRWPGPLETRIARTTAALMRGGDEHATIMLDDARGWMRDAREEIARLTAERDALDSDLGNLLARIFRDGGQRAGELSMDDALHLADKTIATVYAERDALRAAVERVRPVVDGLAEWFDSRADSYKRGGDEPPPLDEITGPLGVHNGSWPDDVCGDCAAALRALLADVPEVAP